MTQPIKQAMADFEKVLSVTPMTDSQKAAFRQMVARMAKGEPTAKIMADLVDDLGCSAQQGHRITDTGEQSEGEH
jgi:hypothetical protein